MHTILCSLKPVLQQFGKVFNRDYWLRETNNEADVQRIQYLLEKSVIAEPTPHDKIKKGFLHDGPFEKEVNNNGMIIIKTPVEELRISKWSLVYVRKHRRMDGSNKMYVVVNRSNMTFDSESSNISVGFMKSFIERYHATVTKYSPYTMA